MKPVVRNILLSLVVCLILTYVIGSAVYTSRQVRYEQLPTLVFDIRDRDTRLYLTEQELQTLADRHLSKAENREQSIRTQSLEDVIRAHPMVRTAECFLESDGTMHVRITQRVPLVRIITSAESYIVDTDRRRMPIRESITDPLLVAEGNIGERMATHEIADFAVWLRGEHYWRERVASVRVINPKMVEIIRTDAEPKIILGEWSDYAGKLRRVRTYYEQGIERMSTPPTYRELDLRFSNQVIAR